MEWLIGTQILLGSSLISALISVLSQASIKGATEDPYHEPCVVISSAKTNIFFLVIFIEPFLVSLDNPSWHYLVYLLLTLICICGGQLFICCSLLPWISNFSVFLLLAFIHRAVLKLNIW